jgi:hypothetical protein
MSALIVVLILFMAMSMTGFFVYWYFNNFLGSTIATARVASLSSIDFAKQEMCACQLITQYTHDPANCELKGRDRVDLLADISRDNADCLNIFQLCGLPGDPGLPPTCTGGPVTNIPFECTGLCLFIQRAECMDGPDCLLTIGGST